MTRRKKSEPVISRSRFVDGKLVWSSTDIALYAGVTHQTVRTWRARYPDFPKPVATLGLIPLYDPIVVSTWFQEKLGLNDERPSPRTHFAAARP